MNRSVFFSRKQKHLTFLVSFVLWIAAFGLGFYGISGGTLRYALVCPLYMALGVSLAYIAFLLPQKLEITEDRFIFYAALKTYSVPLTQVKDVTFLSGVLAARISIKGFVPLFIIEDSDATRSFLDHLKKSLTMRSSECS